MKNDDKPFGFKQKQQNTYQKKKKVEAAKHRMSEMKKLVGVHQF